MKVFDSEGNLHEDALDALYELGNAGGGMVSTAMGKILGVRVKIKTPIVLPISEKGVEDQDVKQIGILMDFCTEIRGAVLFLFDPAFIIRVVESMTDYRCETDSELIEDEMCLSAIQEFANMASAAYMKAIGSYTDIRVFLKPAAVNIDTREALFEKALNRVKKNMKCERAIFVQTDFELTDEKERLIDEKGSVIMYPDENAINKLIEALGL